MKQIVSAGLLKGKVIVPASKSDAQRAILAAALANGESIISGIGPSDDEQAMLQAIQKLGAKVTRIDDRQTVIDGLKNAPESCAISVGESGLTARLLTAVGASFDQKIQLEGHGSITTRPFHFYAETLPHFGAKVNTTNGCLPIQVQGPLQGNSVNVDGSLSSQFISGLLMALPLAEGNSNLEVEQLASGPYVSMTLATLQAFGIQVNHQQLKTFNIFGNQAYKATNYTIDGDWSAASYWLVAAAIGNPVLVAGLNMSSFQADKQLLHFLMHAGCKIIQESNGIVIDGTNRKAFHCDATNCPDLFPALVVLAASIEGVSTIDGATRLIHKESNRALVLQKEFGKLGLKIELEADQMLIYGTGSLSGGDVQSHNDHRIAMCLAIAGTFAKAPITINGSEAVSKSYPAFWEVFQGLVQA